VSLYHIDFSRQLLNLVPRELAERHSLVPIFVRRVRGSGETLYLAMDNPEDEAARDEVSRYAGLPVRAMIAPLSDIRGAIRAYYGGVEGEAQPEQPATSRLSVQPKTQASAPEPAKTPAAGTPVPASRPPDARPSQPPAPRRASVRPAALKTVPKLDTIPPDSGPQISARDVSLPPPKRGRGKMVAVTLLDGTTINLPARRARGAAPDAQPGEEHDDHLTARDLVAALRAVSHGADASEILGEHVQWEKLFAALLSVLLRKHLIADWEFVEEFKKI
jgi:type IV pilus assembly protein PilB